MTQDSSGLYSDIFIVAGTVWQQRHKGEYSQFISQLQWCENVYDALARVVGRNGHGGSLLACIDVDHLDSEEMRIFDCLAGMRQVTGVAFSGSSRSAKLNRARQLGAVAGLRSDELPDWLSRHSIKSVDDRDDVQSGKIAKTVVEEDLEKLVQKQMDSYIPRAEDSSDGSQFSGSRESQSETLEPPVPSSPPPFSQPSEARPRRTPPTNSFVQKPVLSQDEMEALLGQ